MTMNVVDDLLELKFLLKLLFKNHDLTVTLLRSFQLFFIKLNEQNDTINHIC